MTSRFPSDRRPKRYSNRFSGGVRGSGLTPLMAFSDLLAVFFRRFRESVKKAEWSHGIDSHQTILDALKAGRVGEASSELRSHIESHRLRGGS